MSDTQHVPDAVCDYCGLPLPRPWPFRRRHRATDVASPRDATIWEPRFCCYGCRFAAAVTRDRGDVGRETGQLARLGLAVFLSLNVMVFTMVLWSADIYPHAPRHVPVVASMDGLCRWLGLVFSLPVLWLLGGPLAANTWQSLRDRRPSTDALLLSGVAAAYLTSIVAVWRDSGPVYFEVGCAVLVMVTLGRWLEAGGRRRASESLDSLARLLPERVVVVGSEGPREVPLEELRAGDHLRVAAGQRIATDGRIVHGCAAIDEQIISGEHPPLLKEPGDLVFGGTLNLDGDLTIETTATPQSGTIQRLIEAVRRAREAKGRYQHLADRIAGWFLPVVALVAVATFAGHLTLSGLAPAWQAALAVVLIACPCALGLATPMAVWAAMGAAARQQVLFASGEALERLATVATVCFDKTGTLTTGDATLAAVFLDEGESTARLAASVAALAARSDHGLARALAAWGEAHRSCFANELLRDVRVQPGRGLGAELTATGHTIVLGSARWMDELSLGWPVRLRREVEAQMRFGRSVACLATAGRVRALFAFDEELRPSAVAAIEACRQAGLAATVLTGDHRQRGAALARSLGVPVVSELLPEDKAAYVAGLRSHRAVLMVGDGINDAPALARADVGMAMACGADVSRQSADVCLLGNDLLRVPWAVGWARRTVRIVRQNLFWAFVYNVLGIGLAVVGWMNPIWAAAAMVASSALVVANSLRLTRDAPDGPVQALAAEDHGHSMAHLLLASSPAGGAR